MNNKSETVKLGNFMQHAEDGLYGHLSDGMLQAWATWKVSLSLDRVASAIRALGTNDAATSMGAIEYLAKEVHDGMEKIVEVVGRDNI